MANSRELKFRAWDKKHKKMLYLNDEFTRFCLGLTKDNAGRYETNCSQESSCREGADAPIRFGNCEKLIFLQYTGLGDSDAVEEYFGDLIRETDGTIRVIEDGYSAVLFKDTQTGNIKYFWELLPHKVIGNIYEHSSLLEKSDKPRNCEPAWQHLKNILGTKSSREILKEKGD